ncbi:hypothetical protein DNU06_09480 [Putridiphycobacter roseus]|uniref:Peptidase M48 domain-containing protein n=1 Tax=Putridiphycobacter roseus TaxID=2219161 RepID=A0A2W1NMS7_9FLAO|nr:M48 family metallopeptidase [Putridiphycobacter roseus]PZE16972.1 hypothetical protein DNU06_09480 [Putridiphycobacter roseus]
MFKYILLLFHLLFFVCSFGQNYNQYQPIQSSGNVPKDFTRLSTEKLQSDIDQISKKESRKSKKVKEDFYLESNFGIDEILSNGRILFNDPLSNYLNEIYGKIKTVNPSLEQLNVRFYTSRSTIVNAFTTHGGIIFFNIGLLAKLETEDEIAFVMCHELAHFIHKHNIKQYSYNEELDKNKGEFKHENWESKIFAKANYSQAHETDADEIGFNLFKHTHYDQNRVVNVMESLRTYNLPFKSETNFSVAALNLDENNVLFPLVVALDSITVKTYSNNNQLSTHPDIDSRLKALTPHITQENKPATPNAVLTTAQFEMCHLYLEKGMFNHAIYAALSLQKEHPESEYLSEIILKALYGVAQTKTYVFENKSKKDIDYENTEEIAYQAAEIQQIIQFFQELGPIKTNTIAIVALWQQIKSAGTTKNNAMIERLKGLTLSYKDYYESDSNSIAIKALIKNDTEFKQLYNAIIATSALKDIATSEKNFEGVDNMLILSPEYRKFNLKQKKSYKYKASESLLKNYHEIIEDNTAKLDIKNKVLSNSFIKNSEVEMFNDIALINSFLSEKNACTPNVLCSKKEAILDLTNRYGTDKISLMGIYSFQFSKNMSQKIGALVWTGIVFPTLPIGIWYAFKPNYITYNYTFMYSLTTEQLLYANLHPFKMKGNRAVVTSSMYNDLSIIKKGKK